MKKVKVVHIITKLELGGAQQNTLYTVEHLDKNLFDVYLLSGRGGILDGFAKSLVKNSDVKVIFISTLVREINIIKDILAFIEIFELLRKIRPDIIHTHSSKAGIVARWSAFVLNLFSKNKIKIIHTFHGFAFSKFHNFFVRIFYITLEFFTGIISDRLIFVSIDNMNTAKKYKIGMAKNYVLIRSGIKIREFERVSFDNEFKKLKMQNLNLTLKEKVITTIGPFKPQKNLVDFIKMVRFVIDELPDENLIFFIAGDGKQKNLLISLAKKLGVYEKIKFLSWYKDIKGLLAVTDIFVMTSLWEGLPRSAVEALVAGVPVVAYAVDGLNDIIKSGINGYLIEPKDVFNLSKKVILLIRNPDLYNQIKKNTTQTIDKSFDIDYMVLQQQNLYFELTSSKTSKIKN
jgi:glycosyltransferase involved in cell wall biosynthesis